MDIEVNSFYLAAFLLPNMVRAISDKLGPTRAWTKRRETR
jgi:hypothetical protein